MNDNLMNLRLSPVEYDAVTRIDLWVFVMRVFFELEGVPLLDNWHIQKLCAEIDRIRTEPGTRLAIALPPRSLKSIIISVALPAWLLGHDPAAKIVCVSYNQELSDKLAADFRRIMLAPWYKRLFLRTRLLRQSLDDLGTTQGGYRFTTSIQGTLTGIGADVIIVDDPMKPADALSDIERGKVNEWISHTLLTRLNSKQDGRVVVVMQRLHEDDVIGRVTQHARFEEISFAAIADDDEVHQIRTPFGTLIHERKAGEALHPEREPVEVLERQREEMGASWFAAQYQQAPAPVGGGLIKINWFMRYDPAHPLPAFERVIQSWDCAFKMGALNSWTVCTTWGVTRGGHMYLLHVYRAKLEFPEMTKKVRELANQHRAGFVLIEDAASGIPLRQELAREGFARIVAVPVRGEKAVRMNVVTPKLESGRVWIPEQAPWLPDYLHELEMFPRGKHDDQVDSTSQALAFIDEPVPGQGFLDLAQEELNEASLESSSGLMVTFDYVQSDAKFSTNLGRDIMRGSDGFYHVSPAEWPSFNAMKGVTLID